MFYEDLLVARVAVRKYFFRLESGVGESLVRASELLGEEEPYSDLIDTRTRKLDLNLRHVSKRKHEHVETIEEHNEKQSIDRVGLDKAEEIEQEEQMEEEEARRQKEQEEEMLQRESREMEENRKGERVRERGRGEDFIAVSGPTKGRSKMREGRATFSNF